MADRNSDSKRIFLADEERQKRSGPGRLTNAVTSADPSGAKSWTPIGSASPAAVAGQAEHEFRRARPDLVAKRQREGK